MMICLIKFMASLRIIENTQKIVCPARGRVLRRNNSTGKVKFETKQFELQSCPL